MLVRCFDSTFDAVRIFRDRLIDFSNHSGEVDIVDRGVNAELFCVPNGCGHVRSMEQHLRWNTAAVETSPPEWPVINDGDIHITVSGGRGHIEARTGTDDDEVEFFHAPVSVRSH